MVTIVNFFIASLRKPGSANGPSNNASVSDRLFCEEKRKRIRRGKKKKANASNKVCRVFYVNVNGFPHKSIVSNSLYKNMVLTLSC